MFLMISVDRAKPSDREEVEKLIAVYHSSEGPLPVRDRISWVVDQVLRELFPGLLLARDGT